VAKSAPLFRRSISIFTLRLTSASFVASVVFAIADDGFLARRHDDLCDAVLRLGDVELLLVRRVEIGNVLIADADFPRRLRGSSFCDGLLAAQIAFQIVHGDAAIFQLAVKFIFGVGAFHSVNLSSIHRRSRPGLIFSRARENFVVDQLIENIQLERERFFLRRLLAFGTDARAVILIDFVRADVRAVHGGPNVGAGCEF